MKNNAQECLNKLADELLGKDWYITSPVGVNQGNEVIVSAIVEKHKKISLKEKSKRFFGWQRHNFERIENSNYYFCVKCNKVLYLPEYSEFYYQRNQFIGCKG